MKKDQQTTRNRTKKTWIIGRYDHHQNAKGLVMPEINREEDLAASWNRKWI
jgi:hypothetical protein